MTGTHAKQSSIPNGDVSDNLGRSRELTSCGLCVAVECPAKFVPAVSECQPSLRPNSLGVVSVRHGVSRSEFRTSEGEKRSKCWGQLARVGRGDMAVITEADRSTSRWWTTARCAELVR